MPAFAMSWLACFFAAGNMLVFRDDGQLGMPEIGTATPLPVTRRQGLPKPSTGVFTPVTDHTRNHLARPTAQGDPHPGLIALPRDKGPPFVEFELRRLLVSRIWSRQRVA